MNPPSVTQLLGAGPGVTAEDSPQLPHATRKHCLLMGASGRVWEEVGERLPVCQAFASYVQDGPAGERSQAPSAWRWSLGRGGGAGQVVGGGRAGGGDASLDREPERTVLRAERRRGEEVRPLPPGGGAAPRNPREEAVLKGGSGRPWMLLRAAWEAGPACLWGAW